MGVCNCSMFCCTLLYVHSSIAIILMGKRELVALLNLSSWCLVMVERLFLTVPQGCLRFVIVVFPDHTHLLFLLCVTLCQFWFCNHLDWEERVGCFAYFVFLVADDCCVALPRSAMGLSAVLIVVFPDHSHYFWYP